MQGYPIRQSWGEEPIAPNLDRPLSTVSTPPNRLLPRKGAGGAFSPYGLLGRPGPLVSTFYTPQSPLPLPPGILLGYSSSLTTSHSFQTFLGSDHSFSTARQSIAQLPFPCAVKMRSQLLHLLSLGALAITGVAADASCVDCEATLVANSDWSNGVLAQGNYYQPTKTGNWLLGTSSNGEGQLELRNDPANGYYVWNLW